MASLSKVIGALLQMERESPDKRKVMIELPERNEVRLYQLKKVHEESDRIVLVAKRIDDGE